MAQDSTIYTIAEKAGVSAATVSRVINNYPYVNKTTRAKVLKVLSDCNYVPNNAARSLVTQASKMIGILIADLRTTHHTEGVYYIEKEFSSNGYSCLIYNTGTDPEQQAKYIQILGQKQVDAVVLMGSIYQNDTVQNAIMVNIPNIPVAICNGSLDGPNIYNVVADERHGVFQCMKFLAEKGHKNFAFMTNHFTPSNRMKIEGFEEGFQKFVHGGSSVVIETGDTVAEQEAAMHKLLSGKPETDAIVFAEDFMALVGLHVLGEMEVDVPGQIAVLGINNSRYAQISNPALSSLNNMLYDTSIIAARNLLDVLKGERVNRRMMISSELVERKTT